MVDVAGKYDSHSEDFAERSFANLAFTMQRRLSIVARWGTPLKPGDKVLELGCADGYLGNLFSGRGYDYSGVDISPKMLDLARKRLRASGNHGTFIQGDIAKIPLELPYDAIVSYMRTFFNYIPDPLSLLTRFRPLVSNKIILDLNPRKDLSLSAALGILRKAGFTNTAWRPLMVPTTGSLPIPVLRTLAACESIPLLRRLPLRWKFFVLIKGDGG